MTNKLVLIIWIRYTFIIAIVFIAYIINGNRVVIEKGIIRPELSWCDASRRYFFYCTASHSHKDGYKKVRDADLHEPTNENLSNFKEGKDNISSCIEHHNK